MICLFYSFMISSSSPFSSIPQLEKPFQSLELDVIGCTYTLVFKYYVTLKNVTHTDTQSKQLPTRNKV